MIKLSQQQQQKQKPVVINQTINKQRIAKESPKNTFSSEYLLQLVEAIRNGRRDDIQKLLVVIKDLGYIDTATSERGKEGKTALMFASEKGDVPTVKALIEMGADVNKSNYNGKTALMCASDRGKTEVVRVLLEGGALVHVVDRKGGHNALDYASYRGHVETVKVLLHWGARSHNMTSFMKEQIQGGVGTLKRVPKGYPAIIKLLENQGFFITEDLKRHEELRRRK